MVKLPAQEVIEDIFADAREKGCREVELTTTQFYKIYETYFKGYKIEQVGKALTALGFESKKTGRKRVRKIIIHSDGNYYNGTVGDS